MNWWLKLAQAASFARNKTKAGLPSDLEPATISAMNQWAKNQQDIPTDELPFPFWEDKNSSFMSSAWRFTGWGWLWGVRRMVTLRHKSSGKESRWIDGNTTPEAED